MNNSVTPIFEVVSSDSFLEYAFLRWVLAPAVKFKTVNYLKAQQTAAIADRSYRIDYVLIGEGLNLAIELDGFEFHGSRRSFSYDRLRQNDLQANGWTVVRFSYDSIRRETARCVAQLQAMMSLDPSLSRLIVESPVVEEPQMNPDPLFSLTKSPVLSKFSHYQTTDFYFDKVRSRINLETLRGCQREALALLANYFRSGGAKAACVMSVGAGKTALGVVSVLAFARRRALVVTPGSVIRGTFHKAFDNQALGNALYGLPNGPLIPGAKPPQVITLDREDGAIRNITRKDLLRADVIITNFHSLGTGKSQDDVLAKLSPDDVDLIIVDEAHIAAAESYQRTFAHFPAARTLLMSACFQRLDGKPIDADVVYRYRLIDAIADGHAKNLRVRRFAPNAEETTYEMIWSDGSREEIVGREALLEIVKDERKLARITAKSDASIRQVMREVRIALDAQAELLYPIKPRVLFSAMGERHAEQIAAVAENYGIACSHLHHSMSESRIRSIRERFENDSGDLQGIVQLKMLGQGYDFPPITVIVPVRPYNSFSEFYQFVGRGVRVLQHPALINRIKPEQQFLDIIYHAEMGLDEHIDTIYRENDMEPTTAHEIPDERRSIEYNDELPSTRGTETASRLEAFVLFERGDVEKRIVHDESRVEQRKQERELEALAGKYSVYAQNTATPVSFEQFLQIIKRLSE